MVHSCKKKITITPCFYVNCVQCGSSVLKLHYITVMISNYIYCHIFFPRVILYNFFLFWLINGGLGFGVLGLGSYIGFLGLGVSVDGV